MRVAAEVAAEVATQLALAYGPGLLDGGRHHDGAGQADPGRLGQGCLARLGRPAQAMREGGRPKEEEEAEDDGEETRRAGAASPSVSDCWI